MIRVLVPVFTLLLAACATPTPYQPARDGLGYAEQRLESNRYKVTFSGNSRTSKETVENYLLYRAAEVTLRSGYDYFVMAQQGTEAETRYSQTFSGGFGSGFYSWYPRSAIGFGVGTSIPSTEYQAEANIVMFKGKKAPNDVKAFSASELKANLESLLVRPTP